jgi:hypothetical protein
MLIKADEGKFMMKMIMQDTIFVEHADTLQQSSIEDT